jgi:hypothetical protein
VIGDGPFKYAVEDIEGVIFQELRTYRIKDGQLRLEVAVREQYKDGDYDDSISYKPIASINK